MTSAFEKLQQQLKQLPGLGFRSAERIALHLLVEHPDRLRTLIDALEEAGRTVHSCARCGNVAEAELCPICEDLRRKNGVICVVEHVPDLIAVERSGAFRGNYHVLHGRLSPLNGVGPDQLTLEKLFARVDAGEATELILALSNEVEGEATCHYITDHLPKNRPITVTRIGFGLPSGGGVVYADAMTLKTALEGRRAFA